MANEDTICLLRECNSGTQMAVSSINEVLGSVKDEKLKDILISSRKHHETLGNELHGLLHRYGDSTRDPGIMAKGMSWIKTNAKLAVDDSDHACADLITEGCSMGVRTIQKHYNHYSAAEPFAREKARELMQIEEGLIGEMKAYL